MDDHPDLQDLGGPIFHQVPHPAEARLTEAKAQVLSAFAGLLWLGFILLLLAAIPLYGWLWGWCL